MKLPPENYRHPTEEECDKLPDGALCLDDQDIWQPMKRSGETVSYCFKKLYAVPIKQAYKVTDPSRPDDLRAMGWSVAVHNDYRLNGVAHTFWLFANGHFALKGEGLTDADALNQVREKVNRLGSALLAPPAKMSTPPPHEADIRIDLPMPKPVRCGRCLKYLTKEITSDVGWSMKGMIIPLCTECGDLIWSQRKQPEIEIIEFLGAEWYVHVPGDQNPAGHKQEVNFLHRRELEGKVPYNAQVLRASDVSWGAQVDPAYDVTAWRPAGHHPMLPRI